eukprot:scaffold39096_cov23-Tisochrysis_lutea.AAC.1
MPEGQEQGPGTDLASWGTRQRHPFSSNPLCSRQVIAPSCGGHPTSAPSNLIFGGVPVERGRGRDRNISVLQSLEYY